MYKWEHTRPKTNNQHIIIKPKKFELNINYRSHDGILRVASSVIDLIWYFFPDSIDKLSRERGEVDGPRPIIYDGFQTPDFNKFFSMDGDKDNIEFVARQVIIVRNEDARSEV